MQRPRQFMSDEVWEIILHKYIVPYWHLNEHLNPPTFIGNKDGEPLIDKTFPKKLKELSEVVPGMHVSIYSHGLLLKREFIDFLGTLPNRVRLLVSFHFYNHDGTENDYTRTTEVLREAAHNKPANVELILSSHLYPPMTHDRLVAWRESWNGVPNLTVHANVRINPWTGFTKGEGLTEFHCCPYEKFDHMFFGCTGNVLSCCMDLEEEIIFGNVMRDDPETMLGTVRAFYAAQARHEVSHAVCHDCFGLPPAPRPLVQLGAI